MPTLENPVNIAHARLLTDGTYEIHTLEEHLRKTAELAGHFAEAFGSKGWGEYLGLWHDLGKYNPYFQTYIRRASGMELGAPMAKTDHSTAGALFAKQSPNTSRLFPPLAYCIAGHHGGLPNWNGGLDDRLANPEKKELLDVSLSQAPALLKVFSESLPMPQLSTKHPERQLHHWVRMLFSTLVDADWLDTERFMQPEQAALRGSSKTMGELKICYDRYMERFAPSPSDTPIHKERQAIRAACRKSGQGSRGIYNLTVPTGGGKTLASMAFALEHAVVHGLSRIIVVIPYTSIITQTAAIYRAIFGDDQVVEHHSNVIDESNSVSGELKRASQLATENWDAPIVVTTNVQLFESLYASKRSRCRKLHNIANSVIVLDEAQMLPVEFLKPILHGLETLNELFGVTLLFTTATQPVLGGEIGSGEAKFRGIEQKLTDIIEESDQLFARFERVTLQFPQGNEESSYDDLAEQLLKHEQVLCIVNTRAEAQEIYKRMPADTLHLSRMMCSAHLMERIEEMKGRLSRGEPIRVISTALIEAGVDIDFPVVYRAFAGLDSIAQAAGRCNREGRFERGTLHVFHSVKQPPAGLMRKGAQALKEIRLLHNDADLLTPSVLRHYFQLFYASANNFDKGDVKALLYDGARSLRFDFADAADAFQLIDDKDCVSFLVPYGEGVNFIGRLMRKGPEKWLMRKLQQYSVSLHRSHFKKLCDAGFVTQFGEIYILDHAANYHSSLGVVLENQLLEEIFVL